VGFFIFPAPRAGLGRPAAILFWKESAGAGCSRTSFSGGS
jgi:hypothetical protein